MSSCERVRGRPGTGGLGADRHGGDAGCPRPVRRLRDGRRRDRPPARREGARGRRLLPRGRPLAGSTWGCAAWCSPRCAPAPPRRSATPPCRWRTWSPTAPTSRSCSTRRTPPCCRCCGRRGSRWPCTSTGWSGSAASGARPGGATTCVAERLAVRWSDALIADAVGIQDYYRERYGAPSRFLPYGAPVLERPGAAPAARARPRRRRLPPRRRAARAREPRGRRPAGLLASSCEQPLVVVGSAPYAERARRRGEPARSLRPAGAHARRRLGPGAARRAVRRRVVLPARPLRRRHQPLAAARPRRRRAASWRSTSTSTAR